MFHRLLLQSDPLISLKRGLGKSKSRELTDEMKDLIDVDTDEENDGTGDSEVNNHDTAPYDNSDDDDDEDEEDDDDNSDDDDHDDDDHDDDDMSDSDSYVDESE